ncbi:hypothetical protein [Actinoplanes subglobosus]|uniref:Secreted protein n=1 Tax=Actinoplanes subglobosus TaxID=1547892 RepID=A0ABV8IR74_9ACTN
MGALAAAVGFVSQPASAEAAADEPSSIVEDFSYPNAEDITGVKLIRGDGNITYVGCSEENVSLAVWSYTASQPFCFRIVGKTGHLTVELQQVYGFRNYEDFAVGATVSLNGAPATGAIVPADDWLGVGSGSSTGGQVAMLEIRV